MSSRDDIHFWLSRTQSSSYIPAHTTLTTHNGGLQTPLTTGFQPPQSSLGLVGLLC